MCDRFTQSKFALTVAQKMSYDEGFDFTENNIVSYLAELEEYICSLVTYTAHKRDDPNAAISAIPLDRLDKKDHDLKPLAIDAPTQPEIAAWDENHENAMPQEAREIISGKELYANFIKIKSFEEAGIGYSKPGVESEEMLDEVAGGQP